MKKTVQFYENKWLNSYLSEVCNNMRNDLRYIITSDMHDDSERKEYIQALNILKEVLAFDTYDIDNDLNEQLERELKFFKEYFS